MSKIIVGADVSGDACPRGQAMYIALVFGTPDSIERAHQRIGIPSIHMTRLSKPKQQRVIRNLDLKDKDLSAACLHVQKQKIIEEILSDPRFKTRNVPRRNMYKHFDHLLFKEIRDIAESFMFSRGCELKDVTMQCDSDMVKTGTNWKMGVVEEGKAYEIADAIAWCNRRGTKIKQCKELDPVKKLRIDMRRDLLE